jgi:ABC-2 type transport system permease protein/sodium transport system permease protein
MRDPNPNAFGLSRVFRLARKELREILRDRRTILTLVAMPVLLYPLMSVVFLQFSLASKVAPKGAPVFDIGVLTGPEARAVEHRFDLGQKALRGGRPRPARDTPQLTWFYADPIRQPATQEERAIQLEYLKQWLREPMQMDRKLDLVIVIPNLDPDEVDIAKKGPAADKFLPVQIYVQPNNPYGLTALRHIETAFAAADTADLKARLNKPGVKPHLMLSPQLVMLEKTGPDGFISLAALVPLILILMTITGAVYPAIDLTAGERERGTLEILVAAPVPRFELLTAKYLSVLTVAVLTALVNLTCMAITLSWSGMAATLFGAEGVSLGLLVQVLALLLLFAAFFSAVLLCLTSFARSFKEAQAYLIPLMLASLAPGVMAMLPGLKLEGVLTVLPLVNIVLMARDLFEGSVEAGTATIVIVTTLLYALAALGLAARVFGAESVLYSEQSSWADLLSRPQAPQPCLTISAALWCLALMVPIQFSLFALVRAVGTSMPPWLGIMAGVAVNLLLFGMLPALFAYLGRLDLRQALGVQIPRPTALAAAVLLGVSLWPLELCLLVENGLSQVLQERFGEVLKSLKEARESVGYGVLALVIVPAILEEIFFRGLLWSALKSRCGALLTIGVSGLLFGATHVILDGALGLERLVPSTLLGLILSVVCWRSGSLWPSLIVHVLHNTILLLVGLGESGATREIPWQWLAGGAAGTLIGGLLLWLGSGNGSEGS